MSKIIFFLLFSFSSYADFLDIQCDEKMNQAFIQSWNNDGYIDENSAIVKNAEVKFSYTGEALLTLDNKKPRLVNHKKTENGFLVSLKDQPSNPFSPGRDYIFTLDDRYGDFSGELEIRQTGGFAGNILVKKLACIYYQD